MYSMMSNCPLESWLTNMELNVGTFPIQDKASKTKFSLPLL